MDDILTSGARALGIELQPDQVEQFRAYTRLLLEWNEKFNLTRITDPVDIAVKHYLDSLTSLSAAEFPKGALVADVGTGAGFPGVPIAIVRPDLRLVLIEATKQKLRFLEQLRQAILSLAKDGLQIDLVHARAEDAGRMPEHRERYDVVLARAVAEMRVLAEYCLPLAKVGGVFIAMKGSDVDEELEAARPAIGTLGGAPPKLIRLTLPYADIGRTLVVVKKAKPTPEQFPRHGSKIAKRPV